MATLGYSVKTLDVVLHETERARQLQTTRVANMHSRASVLLGASGIAAGLVTTVATSVFWIIPLALFAIAALFGLLVLLPSNQRLSGPRSLLNASIGLQSRQVIFEIVDAIAIEFEDLERRLKSLLWFARLGFISFAVAVLSIVAVSSISIVVGSPPTPLPTTHVIIEK
jgi:hypothetical protein